MFYRGKISLVFINIPNEVILIIIKLNKIIFELQLINKIRFYYNKNVKFLK